MDNSRLRSLETSYYRILSKDWQQDDRETISLLGGRKAYFTSLDGIFEIDIEVPGKTERVVVPVGKTLPLLTGTIVHIRCINQSAQSSTLLMRGENESEDFRIFDPKVPQKEFSWNGELQVGMPASQSEILEIYSKIHSCSISTQSPYFMYQLFAGSMPQAHWAQDFSRHLKASLATREATPVFSAIEDEVIGALCRKFGWAVHEKSGIAVPGGSAANFMAVHCARQRLVPSVKTQGMTRPHLRVYVSSAAHYSFKKALVVLGFGENALVQVPVNGADQMLSAELRRLIHRDLSENLVPLMVVSTAGTTVAGAFDPIREVAQVASEFQIWHHVDASWGGPVVFSRRLKHLMEGAQDADSVTFDSHKLFGASLPTSFLLTKDVSILQKANDVSGGDYLFHDAEDHIQTASSNTTDLGRLSWQCGRGPDTFNFWSIWKHLGDEGLGRFVDGLLDVRESLIPWIESQPRLCLLSSPQYLNICVRVTPPSGVSLSDGDWTTRVRQELMKSQTAMINYSSDANGVFLRLVLVHPHLKFTHLKEILLAALEVK